MSENEENTNINGDKKPLSELTQMVERLEKANKEAKDNLSKQEELMALNLISGKSDAGIQTPKEVVETPLEYAKRVLSNKI
jgi:hypothetical protein